MERKLELDHQATSLLQRLVQQCSYSGHEKGTAEVFVNALIDLGFSDVHIDDYGNVIGSKIGAKPGPRLLFDAHMDVVNAGNHEEWKKDPFCGAENDGMIYGRGATDTKGSMAAMAIALASLQPDEFDGTLFITGSVGEEIIEGAGLMKVLEAVRPQGVIVGEPTDCRLAFGQKGRARLLFKALGRPSYSSTPEIGDSALLKAGKMLSIIQNMPLPQDPWLGKGIFAPIQIQSFPFPSTSTIPFECQVIADRRLVQGETMAGILDEYNATLKEVPGCEAFIDEVSYDTYTGKTFRVPDYHAGWRMDPQSSWIQSALDGLRESGNTLEPYTVPYCTNGCVSAGDLGLPTLIFGPGSIHQAHAIDETLKVSELMTALHGFRSLAQHLSRIGY